MVKSTIYKLHCKNPDVTECYVGKTIDVSMRRNTHKTKCNNEKCKEYNFKVYKFIRENGGFENWILEEIETIEHDSENNVLVREREYYWFNELKATLNNNTPNQSHIVSSKIWRDNNKEYSKEYGKIYKEKNKEQIKIRTKAYYEKNKDKLKANCKKWISNEENREKNRIYQRERCRKIAELKKLQKLEVNNEEL